MKGMQKFVPQPLQKAAAAAQETAEDLDIDLNDPDLSKAATKIQASFRGHKTRKDIKDDKDTVVTNIKEGISSAANAASDAADEIADIDLTDPDLAKAATKIQASFRGYQTRRDPKSQ